MSTYVCRSIRGVCICVPFVCVMCVCVCVYSEGGRAKGLRNSVVVEFTHNKSCMGWRWSVGSIRL